jgi:cell division septation protein DedD
MTIRDADRLRDKLEVSLDGRQVFFLFFGGAIVACLVFVLGVMVGKRLESRERVARRAVTSAAVDPLAALDELGADERGGDDLAFPVALAGDEKARARALAADDLPAPRSLAPEAGGTVTSAARAAAARIAAAAAQPDPPPAARPETAAPAAAPAEKRFTLQISSFQERAEADALSAKLTSAGYKPFIVMSDVPDRGIFFRVRIGEYATRDEALAAKETFEDKEHIIAYVTRI